MPDPVKIRAVIADDEPLARRGVRQLLARESDVEVLGEARNGRETIEMVRALRPDLLFLDVQMPGPDGFAVLEAFADAPPSAIIFVTAHDDFAVRAFTAHALDYLVKPLEEARFAEALQRARERLQSIAALELSRRLSALLANRGLSDPAGNAANARLVIHTSTGELVVDTDEIDWIEADDYYAAVHAGGRRHLMRQSLAVLEKRLDANRFVRAHRGAIVNLQRVRELRASAGDVVLVLRDGTRIPVSRRRREHVAKRLRVLGA
jgi:two-component system LytT family response regulator